ncbi:MAG TPA: hypothetical protein VF681_00265 [Abditibacteriaceae bacterium]|jgi:hypothetical protein
MSHSELRWTFPLPRPHCGIALGNGTQGVLVWGDEWLCLTVARAGFWDRRGGNPFTTSATFPKVRALLEANDEAGIKELFVQAPKNASTPPRPQQVGGARLELHFPDGFRPKTGALTRDGVVTIELVNDAGATREVRIEMSMDAEVSWIDGASDAQLRLRPSYEWTKEKLAAWGVAPPYDIEIEDGLGFVQPLPADDALAMVVRKRDDRLFIATALGEVEDAAKEAVARARAVPETDSSYFWKRYYRDVPTVQLPDPALQHFWELALHKQAGITTPHGVAATLQGPWMEEYQLPPWSNDYHFNINAQMIYWPALATNRLEHFEPLWAMIREWMPILQENGETFFGCKGALMLPHAVDDRCQVVGTFWAGTIDHACTAWMAQMAWLHYRYGMDETLLREVAWPLLNGAFEGYHAMHEEKDGHFSLPISVSPEYRGSQMDAWGRDASFQLAAWHQIAQILPLAAQALGEDLDPRWSEVEEKLPPYCLVNGRIGLWEGLELEESHRHHSHLASIWPFMSIDPFSEKHWTTVVKSVEFWNKIGPGNWTGWCTPWASVLCSRLELPDAAVTWMHWLIHNFTNEGYGTLHNADFPGTGTFNDGSFHDRKKPPGEVMQMDATMGFLIAVTELLVQNRHDGIHILPKIPRRWKELSFDGIRTEGAFLVGATVENGTISAVRVTAEKGGALNLYPGFGEKIERAMKAGETLVLRP